MFRELAVSYMSRFDLAHVDPGDSNFDAMGKGVEEGKEPADSRQANKYLSKGLTRSRSDNLVVMRGVDVDARGSGNVTAIAGHGASARIADTEGAVALKHTICAEESGRDPVEPVRQRRRGSRPKQGRTPGRSQGQGLRRRDVLGVRQLHAGTERHVHEVRYVWQHDGVQLS